jgi:hypothetical protein
MTRATSLMAPEWYREGRVFAVSRKVPVYAPPDARGTGRSTQGEDLMTRLACVVLATSLLGIGLTDEPEATDPDSADE